jgi:hypothetical protein
MPHGALSVLRAYIHAIPEQTEGDYRTTQSQSPKIRPVK